MSDERLPLSRRSFLSTATAAGVGAMTLGAVARADDAAPPVPAAGARHPVKIDDDVDAAA